MQKKRILAFTAGLAALMAACSGTPTPSESDIDPVPYASTPVTGQPQFAPNEVIVKFKSDTVAPANLGLASSSLQAKRELGGGEMLYSIGGELSTTSVGKGVLETVKTLQARADVEFAQPNYYYYPMAVTPNDPLYKYQWHYSAIKLPNAWDLTTGSSSVVVAVLDTGKMDHPDLEGQFLPGYDFITDAVDAGDGDGRDSDPTNPNTALNASHGTHVAGTIAALSNNGVGVTGVCWNCKVLPVRVVGDVNATTADIVAGIRWAAGLRVNGITTNPNPAKVINMSLGGEFSCGADSAFQNSINAVYDRGVSVVVSAGNSNKDAAGFTPASCNNVITVAATTYFSKRASYASAYNYSDDYPDAVLSTTRHKKGVYNYRSYQGTSMAAPHVSGVIGLMLSLDNSLTPAQILAKLQSTAKVIPVEKCSGGCGAGLIDANAALR
jgi:serine protease